MKKVQVILKDESTLQLQENAQVGDIIDLNDLHTIDTTHLQDLLEKEKNSIYQQKLEQEKNVLRLQNESEKMQLKNQFEKKLQSLDNEKTLKLTEQKSIYETQILQLNNELSNLKSSLQAEIEKNVLQKEKEFTQKIQSLQIELEKLHNEQELNLIKQESDLHKQYQSEKEKLKQDYEKMIQKQSEEINKLTFLKSVKNVKQTGEDLETWCNREVQSYMQNGLQNCVWQKDNLIIKDIDEQKGSKSDFIFQIYASNQHLPHELLTSVCLEMKDENPDSTNKKKNEDYYKQLDKNREKKNCKYALLVSNLELDKPNDLPIYKVLNYEDMYVVRPAYLMVFLNMLVSLTNKYKELLLVAEKEKLDLLETTELIEEFERLKMTYLEKPLQILQNEINKIVKSSETIKKAAYEVDMAVENIIQKYLKDIQNKLERFNIKKITKRLEKVIN